MKRVFQLSCAGLLLLVGGGTARAQDQAALTSAREVAREGLEDYDQGRYADAAQKLAGAYGVIHVPTLAVFTARAYAKSGRLVEAAETYLEATRMPTPSFDKEKHEQAKQDADREREELVPRIPRLRIELEGAAAGAVSVTVDGGAVPASLFALGHLVNPGERKVVGKLGDQVVEQTVTIAERETKTVKLVFVGVAGQPGLTETKPEASRPGVERPVSPASPPAATSSGPAAPEADAGTGSAQRTAGYLGLGLGGAGLVFGAVTGFMALRDQGKLDDGGCRNGGCYNNQRSSVDAYNSKVTLSTVGFIVGGVGLAAGGVLLLTLPSAKSQKPEVAAWLGAGSAGVAGRF